MVAGAPLPPMQKCKPFLTGAISANKWVSAEEGKGTSDNTPGAEDSLIVEVTIDRRQDVCCTQSYRSAVGGEVRVRTTFDGTNSDYRGYGCGKMEYF